MRGPLQRKVDPLVTTMTETQRLTGNLAAAASDASDQLQTIIQRLLSGAADGAMQGAAADQLLLTTQDRLKALNSLSGAMATVSAAAGRLAWAAPLIAAKYDAEIGLGLAEQAVEVVSAGLDLIALAQGGLDPISDVMALLGIGIDLTFKLLVGEIVQRFVFSLFDPIRDYQSAVQKVIDSLIPMSGPTNLQLVYDLTVEQYGTGTPIAIYTTASGSILVTVAGLEPTNLTQANNLFSTLDAGLGDPNNPYANDVRQSINQYIAEHHLPADTQVVIAGHSDGGIVAQQVAADPENMHYRVSEVITFGSPQVEAQIQATTYHEYATQNDPVPLLSWREDGALVRRYGYIGALQRLSAINSDPNAKQRFTGETILRDAGNDPSPWEWVNDHGAYQYSQTLANTPTDFQVSSWSAKQPFSTTPQNPFTNAGQASTQFRVDQSLQ